MNASPLPSPPLSRLLELTADAVAAAFGVELYEHPEILGMMTARWGDQLNAARRRMARVPVPHKVALVQGGQWREPPALRSDPLFRGYVVFLVNPR